MISEMYGRQLNVNDYFLCCLYDWSFSTVIVGRVYAEDKYMVFFNGKYHNILDVNIEQYVHRNKIYKLTGVNHLFAKYHQKNMLFPDMINELYFGIYYKTRDIFTEILGRPLYIGDFVMYKKKNAQFTARGVEYGIVVDQRHILTKFNTLKKVDLVYKVDVRTSEEDAVYKEIVSLYNQRMKDGRKVATHKELHIGDVYVRGAYTYIYIGKYHIKSNKDVRYSNVVKHVYLRLDTKRQKVAKLLIEMKNGNFSNLDSYIQSLYHNYAHAVPPNCFHLVDEPHFKSGYAGHLDLVPCDYTFGDDSGMIQMIRCND